MTDEVYIFFSLVFWEWSERLLLSTSASNWKFSWMDYEPRAG